MKNMNTFSIVDEISIYWTLCHYKRFLDVLYYNNI